jgi:hypothetical protein
MSTKEAVVSTVTHDHDYAIPAASPAAVRGFSDDQGCRLAPAPNTAAGQSPATEQMPENNVSTSLAVGNQHHVIYSPTDDFIKSQTISSTATSTSGETPTPRKQRKQQLQPTIDYDLELSSVPAVNTPVTGHADLPVTVSFSRMALTGGQMPSRDTTSNEVSFPSYLVQTNNLFVSQRKLFAISCKLISSVSV